MNVTFVLIYVLEEHQDHLPTSFYRLISHVIINNDRQRHIREELKSLNLQLLFMLYWAVGN